MEGLSMFIIVLISCSIYNPSCCYYKKLCKNALKVKCKKINIIPTKLHIGTKLTNFINIQYCMTIHIYLYKNNLF